MAETATATAAAAAVSGEKLTALFVLALGPVAGPWALILAAAGSGALFGASGVRTASRVDAMRLVVALMGMAVFLTGFLSSLIERYYGISVGEAIAPVAWLIGAMGKKWAPILSTLGDGLRNFVKGFVK